MAMSPAQKAANRARRAVRDGAYRQRLQTFTRALMAADASEEVIQAKRSYDEADQVFQSAVHARDERAREISNRIDELRAQLDELLAHTRPELDQLHRQRRALADVWRTKRTAAAQEVQKQFPDLAGPARFSATAWQPPAEVLAEMEAAAQATGSAQTAEAPPAGAGRDGRDPSRDC